MRISHSAARILALTAGFLCALGAHSQTIEEFKNSKSAADAGRLCDSIPYSGLRSSCNDASRDVNDYCKTENTGCADLNVYARLQDREKSKRDLDQLERTRNDLRTQRDGAKEEDKKKAFQNQIDQFEKDIDAKKREIDSLGKTIDDFKYAANGRIEKNKRCIDARKKAVSIFDEAMGKVTDAREQEKKDIAYTLVAKWNAEEAGHKTQLDNTQNRLARCEKAARGEQF